MAFRDTLKRVATSAGETIAENTGMLSIAKGLTDEQLNHAARMDHIIGGLQTLAGGPKRTGPSEDPLRDMWIATNTSYSGSDCVPVVQINGTLITLGNVQTISISTFREKEPVRVLGKSYVKGYTGGPRTIAGSITFTVFHRDPFWDILKHLRENNKTPNDRYHTPIGDQIPPVNLILWFSNEYGRKSIQTIYGIEFNQEGQVHSINDVYSEKTVNYVARDMDILVDYSDVEGFRNLMYERQLTGQFTDNYLVSLLEYRRKLEKQIYDINVIIERIKLEKGRRGIVTFGLSSLLGNKDLKDELQKLVRQKTLLVNELIETDKSISAWSKSAYGTDNYFESNGAANDNLKQAPTVGGGAIPEELQGLATEEAWNREYNKLKTEGYRAKSYDALGEFVFEHPETQIQRDENGNPILSPVDPLKQGGDFVTTSSDIVTA